MVTIMKETPRVLSATNPITNETTSPARIPAANAAGACQPK
jgi:hypothetical protein